MSLDLEVNIQASLGYNACTLWLRVGVAWKKIVYFGVVVAACWSWT